MLEAAQRSSPSATPRGDFGVGIDACVAPRPVQVLPKLRASPRLRVMLLLFQSVDAVPTRNGAHGSDSTRPRRKNHGLRRPPRGGDAELQQMLGLSTLRYSRHELPTVHSAAEPPSSGPTRRTRSSARRPRSSEIQYRTPVAAETVRSRSEGPVRPGPRSIAAPTPAPTYGASHGPAGSCAWSCASGTTRVVGRPSRCSGRVAASPPSSRRYDVSGSSPRAASTGAVPMPSRSYWNAPALSDRLGRRPSVGSDQLRV